MSDDHNGTPPPEDPYINAQFRWKYENRADFGGGVWVLRVENTPEPQIAFFTQKPKDTSPEDLAAFTVKVYGVEYNDSLTIFVVWSQREAENNTL